MHIPSKYQNMLRSQVRNVAQTTETEILYPDHEQYAVYASPVNTEEMPKDDYIIVKIVGTVHGYRQAREKLKVRRPVIPICTFNLTFRDTLTKCGSVPYRFKFP